ncbi:VMAP-C domain-containing protein [Nonomuraea sp. NPDC002799]
MIHPARPANVWRARIDGIWDQSRQTLGAGFLVAPNLVLTCAHVVSEPGQTLRVSFTQADRHDLLEIPATVYAKGPWRRRNDPGDVAVLRLEREVDLAPAHLLPSPSTTTGQSAHGFPLDQGEAGAPLSLAPISTELIGEWWHLTAATPYAEVPRRGFSGAAVYDETTGSVIGMITDYSESLNRLTGRMLPITTIRRHWEELDDLLDIAWLPALERRELREIVHDAALAKGTDLRLLVAQTFPGMGGHRDFRSAWDAIRYVGEELPGDDRMSRFLPKVTAVLDDAATQGRLKGWINRHLQVRAQPSAKETSVIVRLDPVRDGYDLSLSTLVDGEPYPGMNPMVISRPELRARVEEGFAAVRMDVAGTEPMIEFVLPQSMLNEPVDEWDFAKDTPLVGYKVVVRYADRLIALDKWDPWIVRSRNLRQEPRNSPELVGCLGDDPKRVYLRLLLRKKNCVLVHAAQPDDALLSSELHAGLPVMVWPRARCTEPDHGTCTAHLRHEQLAHLIGEVHADEIPELVRVLRLEAALEDSGQPACGLTLLWDDPRRMPDPPAYMPERE